MIEAQIELKDPAVLRALLDILSMQRWEILRRAARPLSLAEIASAANASVEETQRSLDILVEAKLVEVSPATTRRRHVAYRAPMKRLYVQWDRSDPAGAAAWNAIGQHMRDYSRKVQDEAAKIPGAEQFAPLNYSAVLTATLTDEDAVRVREALRTAYVMLAEAGARARGLPDSSGCNPYHVNFNLWRLIAKPLPMAEYFVIERGTLANDRKVLESGASRVLSPREFQIARLLEAGRTRPSIAQELGLTPNTVASLSKIIYRKLDVRSRAELVARMRLS